MYICECGWKHNDSKCPKCGTEPPNTSKGVKAHNSTLRTYKKMKKTPLNPVSKKRRKGTQKKAMLVFASSQEKVCSHCGIPIKEMKYSNVDHVDPKGKYPEKRDDVNNFRILCTWIDLQNYSDYSFGSLTSEQNRMNSIGSCHYLRHNGTKKQFENRKDLFLKT